MKTTCSVKDCDNDVRPNQRYCRSCHNKTEKKRYAAGLVLIKPKNNEAILKAKARRRAQYAESSGLIVSPGECERCHKDLPLEKHHHDYSKPLEVEWLCSLCHGLEHSKKPVLDEIS